jgi:hypothetical protein
MNHNGPEGKVPCTGRGLGPCRKPSVSSPGSDEYKLVKGMGLKRKAGGGHVKGRRLQTETIKNKIMKIAISGQDEDLTICFCSLILL